MFESLLQAPSLSSIAKQHEIESTTTSIPEAVFSSPQKSRVELRDKMHSLENSWKAFGGRNR